MIRRSCLVNLFCILVFACGPKAGPPHSKPETSMSVPSRQMPALEFIPEMQSFGNEFIPTPPTLDSLTQKSFASLWRTQAPEICKTIRPDSLSRISRWAKEQMKSFQLPANWWEKIPMRPMGASADSQTILFGPFKEEGLPLPSHHPLVFRRLVISACYHLPTHTLTRVIVSIGGWVEE
jgi:hypothetical protein